MERVLIVIPARGGSKGVPRKNLRPLRNKPLIYYPIQAALGVDGATVVVSTEDEEIAMFARRFGADVCIRPKTLAGDEVTLDPVVAHTVEEEEKRRGQAFDLVITVQPTAPLLKSQHIQDVVAIFQQDPGLDTVLSVVDDRHLRWKKEGEELRPDYRERLNRLDLPESYRENGAIIACRRRVLDSGTRIGVRIAPYIMPAKLSVDIDNAVDFQIIEALLARKNILISVTGNQSNGLGHAARGVLLAHELVGHQVTFLCEESDVLARKYIESQNYRLLVCKDGERLALILEESPDLVINDTLDTTEAELRPIKEAGIRLVAFEDLGEGAQYADVVINALYPHQERRENVYVGEKYFCVRQEFIHMGKRHLHEEVHRVLVTFGGADEGNLTCRVIRILYEYLLAKEIHLDVVLGPGYEFHEELEQLRKELSSDLVHVIPATCCISEYMQQAGLCVTSGGRTVLEVASLHIPTLVICQNERETTHSYASQENGVLNLGERTQVSDAEILEAFQTLVEDRDRRQEMIRIMKEKDLISGSGRVVQIITKLLEE